MDANGIEKEQLEKEALEHLNWATKIVSIHNCDDILKKWIGMSFNYDIMEYTDHPYINLQNGVLDLRTRELLPHSTEYRQHKIFNCDYDPQAICPTFDRMLETLVPDEEVRKELMKALGLTLTKAKLLPGSKSLFLLIGKKDSGKTTFINAINNVLGDFGVNIDNSLLMQGYKSSSNIGPELITLYDARLVSTSELSQDARLNSAKVKAMTGNNVLTTRNLFDRSMFSFIFRGQIWIDSNYKPVIENDEAMWGRVRIFPFNQVIKSKDKDIYEKLEAEKAGIFNRLLEAMAQVEQEDGEIYECEAMLEAKNDYKIEVTPTDQFVDECLIITKDSQDRIEPPKMYQTYQNWAEDFGYRAMNKSRFYAEISNYSERKKSYSEYFGGVKLTTVGTLYYHKKEMTQQEFARQKRKLVESHDSELSYIILRDQQYQKSKEWFRENIDLITLNTDIYNDNHNKYPLYADWCIDKMFTPLKSSDFNIKCVYIKDHFTKEHYNKVELIQRLLNEADNLWSN